MRQALSTSTLTRRACAKINLTLDVFSKRADGYHSIASVMQAIGVYDTLILRRIPENGIRFTCDAPDAPDVPEDATNLVVRAAQAAIDAALAAGHTPDGGVAIHLEKRIPSQAGLGGGSSDAAAALVGVNDLLELGLDAATLRDGAATLGSDVTFFLYGGTAVARGRGETLTPLADIPPLWLVVVKPEESVSTGWAYNELDNAPDRQSHRGTKRLEEALRAGDMERLVAFQSNDFELPVFNHYPKLSWLHDELRMAGAETAHLCGSGAALYGVAANEAAAERIAALLRRRYGQVFVARTLTRAESLPARGVE
jgi:4-diphosphocytidyl-2-C-methyl-D-erythritol kinase